MNSILVVDGSYLIHRNLHALSDKSDEMIIYVLLKTLSVAAEKYKPNAYLLAFDKGQSIARTAVMPEYKASRRLDPTTATPKELKEKEEFYARYRNIVDFIHNEFPNIGIGVVTIPGVEADDIGYVLSNHTHHKVILETDDRDWIQSINEKTVLYRPRDEEEINLERVQNEYGCVKRYRLLKALGGKSGEFDGFAGVGPVKCRAAMEKLWEPAMQEVLLDPTRLSDPKFNKITQEWSRFLTNYEVAGFDGIYDPRLKFIIEEGLKIAVSKVKKPSQLDWVKFCGKIRSSNLLEKYHILFSNVNKDFIPESVALDWSM